MKRNTITQGTAETITKTVELTTRIKTDHDQTKVIVSAVTITIDLQDLLSGPYGVGEKAATNKSRKSVEAGGAITCKASRIKEYTEPGHVH